MDLVVFDHDLSNTHLCKSERIEVRQVFAWSIFKLASVRFKIFTKKNRFASVLKKYEPIPSLHTTKTCINKNNETLQTRQTRKKILVRKYVIDVGHRTEKWTPWEFSMARIMVFLLIDQAQPKTIRPSLIEW